MGALNNCRSPQKIEVEEQSIMQLPTFSEKEKSFAKKIMICFYILNFRKKAKEINKKTTKELEQMIKTYEKDPVDYTLVNNVTKVFEDAIDECNKRIIRLKIEHEVENLLRFKDLSLAKEELRNYYLKQLETHHMNLFEKLVNMINEKEKTSAEIINETNKNGLNKSKDNIKSGLNNSKEMIGISLSSLNINVNNTNNDINNNNTVHIRNKTKPIKSEKILKNDKQKIKEKVSSSDRDKLSKELELLFNYGNINKPTLIINNNSVPDKNASVFLDFYVEDGDYPRSIKQFVNKFFFLSIMKKSGYIRSTGGKYLKIAKKEIKRIMREKNYDEFEKEEIVKEDYGDIAMMLGKMEKEDENKILKSINKLKYGDEIVTRNRANGVTSKLNSKSRRGSNVLGQDLNNETVKLHSSLKFHPINEQQQNTNVFLLNNVKTKELKFNSETTVFQKNSRENEVEEDPNENKSDGSDSNNSVEKNDGKQILSSFNKLQKSLAKKKFGLKQMAYAGSKLKNSADIIKNSLSHFKSNPEKNYQFEFYNGEYDASNYLYCGTGTLVKHALKKYYYTGTFRMGKKNGAGIFFKILSDNELYFYYRGEWANNKQDGYGFSLTIDKKESKTIYRRGKFEKNIFLYGSQIIVEEKNKSEILIEKYEGEFLLELYTGMGALTKKQLKLNKYAEAKYDLEYEYLYEGEFKNNLQHGTGKEEKKFKNQSNSYKYSGDFENGKMHGEGKIEFEGDNYIKSYHGIFEKGEKFCKYGKVEFKSGDIYEGFFDENHQKTKVGLYIYADKINNSNHHLVPNNTKKSEIFFGRFFHDKKEGIGRFLSVGDYKVLVGQYEDGEKNGVFSLAANNFQQDADFENKISFISNFSMSHIRNLSNANVNILNSNANSLINTNSNSPKNSAALKTNLIKQQKTYYLFENDEIIDKSDKPFKKE